VSLDQIRAGKELVPGKYDIDGVTGELVIEDYGPAIYLPGILITTANVDDPSLWGNAKIQ